MIFAHADYQDPADTEPGADQIGDGWDGEETEVREPDQWTLAAMSGEGEDMGDEDQLKLDWNTRLELLLDEANDLQIKSGRYAFDREEKKRVEAAEATIRALGPKARSKRKDAGTTRRKVEAA